VTIAYVAERIGAAAGNASLVRLGTLADRTGEPAEVSADVTRLRGVIGVEQRLTLSECIERTAAWWRVELLRESASSR
jgi:nucleoside-diphosphate-sugar epimerase